MHIIEVTKRIGNDFHFKSYCRHCKHIDRWGDGYADSYYQCEVFPNRFCSNCGKNEFGKLRLDSEVKPVHTGTTTGES